MQGRVAAAATLIGLMTMALAAQTSVVQPKELDALLRSSGEKPAILYVGFAAGYRAGHIPGAVLAGPAESAEGLKTLTAAVMALPRDREWNQCSGDCPECHGDRAR